MTNEFDEQDTATNAITISISITLLLLVITSNFNGMGVMSW